MSLREAAQQALEALERIAYWSEELQERVIAFDKGIMHWRGCVGEANGILPTLRAALADTQDWDEIEALRASLREHMAEIHRLRAAGRQALDALENHTQEAERVGRIAVGINALRATLSWDAMQRLTDEQQMIERGTKAWAGVPDATAWVENLRGNEPVTDCHDKQGDKLAPPLVILAAHVGYRYQSPVGGWEYGDHLPAGFDTDKWAHQKIYVLQEQS